MKVVRSLDEKIWRQFVDDHPQGNVFHTPEMFQVFERTLDHQPTLWAVVNQFDEPLVLFLPVDITLMEGLLKPFTTRSIVYGSVLCSAGADGQTALKKLLTEYREEVGENILFTELRNLFDMSGLQPVLERAQFHHENHLNYLIDLQRPVEEIMQSFGKGTRKKIRRGLRRKLVSVSEGTTFEHVGDCYQLIQKSYQAAKVPVADISLFEAAFDLLYPKGMVRILLAWFEGKSVASSVELIYKDMIYGWYSGLDRSSGAITPSELIMWHILSWGAENGYRFYDFGGAGKPDEEYGVRDFKAKFGGELVNYGRNTHIHAPGNLRISKSGYAIYRALAGFKKN